MLKGAASPLTFLEDLMTPVLKIPLRLGERHIHIVVKWHVNVSRLLLLPLRLPTFATIGPESRTTQSHVTPQGSFHYFSSSPQSHPRTRCSSSCKCNYTNWCGETLPPLCGAMCVYMQNIWKKLILRFSRPFWVFMPEWAWTSYLVHVYMQLRNLNNGLLHIPLSTLGGDLIHYCMLTSG